MYCATSEIMGTPATAPVLVRRLDKNQTDGFMARGFDASEPIYFIGGAKFGLSDILAARVTNQPFRPKPCAVNLPGNINRLLLVDVAEVVPSSGGSPRSGHPNYLVKGWMFPEGFNPATDEFMRVRMLLSMHDTEKVFCADVQRFSEKPDWRKRSRITLVERPNSEVLKDRSRQS